MITSKQVALWADKLRDISALGLRFSDSIYDQERYRAVQDIAMAMLAALTANPVETMEPLRDTLFSRPTPLSVGDAAVINDRGEILLIRRADNGKWAMPGGALEVGETPAEGVVREVLEETGVPCEPVTLIGVFDSRLCGTSSPHHLYHIVFLCKPSSTQAHRSASHAHEVVEVGWFAEDSLPDEIDPGHVSRIPEAYRLWKGEVRPYFDN